MNVFPRTQARALQASVVALLAVFGTFVWADLSRALDGQPEIAFWRVPLLVWAAVGLWRLDALVRWVVLVLLWYYVIVTLLGTINPFYAMDEGGPNPPNVWVLLAGLAPSVLFCLLNLHLLGKYKSEFQVPGARGT